MPFQQYNKVIVCELADSYAKSALGTAMNAPVDMAKARQQWRQYVAALKSTGVEVTVLPKDEKFPDCVFVEDTAVIVHGHALLTRPGDITRRDEVENMRPVLEKQGLVVMQVTDPDALLDGGDVIFTGREILVGLSSRTNHQGLEAIAEAFPGFPVTAIPVSGPLHLTTLLTMCGPNTFCASTESGHSTAMLDKVHSLAKFPYNSLIVSEDKASNVIPINGALLHKSSTENKSSYDTLSTYCSRTVPGEGPTRSIDLDLSEIEKAVGSLTCMSLRFNVSKLIS